jgi:hypothetical protein
MSATSLVVGATWNESRTFSDPLGGRNDVYVMEV